MTNEEKAIEIGNKHSEAIKPSDKQFYSFFRECKDAALEMSEWKDSQFKKELNLIEDWFNHIAQLADDKKTLNGAVMKDSDAFDEIKCLAKRCAEYINKGLVFNGE